MAFKLGMTVDLGMAYICSCILMTLTLMQGDSGLAKATNQCCRVFSQQLSKQ